ncbi:STAS domain-containing protein [Vibrio navarrensis]|uniref:STAS domain-containing protein n=1 Tax=Vibrio navarrensis TaxID=29495 RepID=UPI001869F939|nr:STAS domain-containing protein [Vibrio navarrensis]MBE4587236.1 N-acyl-D-glucosamine 2-epimerase [Vibrio navarrensis]
MLNVDFTFSDMIAGYVQSFDFKTDIAVMHTSDGREFNVKLTDTVFAEVVRNLGEAYRDCTANIRDMLEPGRFLFVYGVFYPEDHKPFEAKHMVFLGQNVGEFRFEKSNWWVEQIDSLADFYINAQFGSGEIDYKKYRTHLTLEGSHEQDMRQETDTISRLVYGFASAYLLTGKDKYLEAAEKGTLYLRENFRARDTQQDITYWYHAIDVKGGKTRKILASEFGDDYDAIPAYEQIYALAGPVQTGRISGDPEIFNDARMTINLFEKYFKDHKQGGYFSHVDPITFNPRADSLTRDRARKNWNSVGDHAPAYLINLFLASGEKQHLDMLTYCADTVVNHFQDYEHSAFVQEKFHEDWSKDQTWGWQQNRAVVGHNLKIAWNLMRIISAKKEDSYQQLAERIAALMPEHGMDKQRTGWYDVVERELADGEQFHRFAWHDRKAWWQQEQGILAYLILHGILGKDEYLKYARESQAFYNAWFLDTDNGGIYFNVLANGLPYLLGQEREKGSHSMSGYHSFELCYLAAVYGNLLIHKQPMDLYFKPLPNGFKNRVLRVAPDILPQDSIVIESVSIDGQPYDKFDAKALTVDLPQSDSRLSVKVRLTPTSGVDHFKVQVEKQAEACVVRLSGAFDERAIPTFSQYVGDMEGSSRLIMECSQLDSICPAAIREIMFIKQKLTIDERLCFVAVNESVQKSLQNSEIFSEIELYSSLDQALSAKR